MADYTASRARLLQKYSKRYATVYGMAFTAESFGNFVLGAGLLAAACIMVAGCGKGGRDLDWLVVGSSVPVTLLSFTVWKAFQIAASLLRVFVDLAVHTSPLLTSEKASIIFEMGLGDAENLTGGIGPAAASADESEARQ